MASVVGTESRDQCHSVLDQDLNLRVAAVETLGHISLVIPKDQFLTNADSLPLSGISLIRAA